MIEKEVRKRSDPYVRSLIGMLRIFKYTVLSFLILLIVYVVAFHGGDFCINSFNVLFSELKPEIRAEPHDYRKVIYEGAEQIGFLSCRMAVSEKNKFELYDKSGKCYVSTYHGFSSPSLLCCDDRAILYDDNGNALKLYDKNSLLRSQSYESPIRFVGLCENGSFAVVTSGGIYRSIVFTYNADFELTFRWLSGDKVVTYAMPDKTGHLTLAYENSAENGKFGLLRCSIVENSEEEILALDKKINRVAEFEYETFCFIGDDAVYFRNEDKLSKQYKYSVVDCMFSNTHMFVETDSSFILFSGTGQLLYELKKENTESKLYLTDSTAFVFYSGKIIKLSIDTLELFEYHIDCDVLGATEYDDCTVIFTPARIKLITNENFN